MGDTMTGELTVNDNDEGGHIRGGYLGTYSFLVLANFEIEPNKAERHT